MIKPGWITNDLEPRMKPGLKGLPQQNPRNYGPATGLR